jgi:hypothetical protein
MIEFFGTTGCIACDLLKPKAFFQNIIEEN